MNDAKAAAHEIEKFFKGPEKYLLLNGTYQNQKHLLAIACIQRFHAGGIVLFRANASSNIGAFLGQTGVTKPRFPQRLGDRHHLYADTINPKSWLKSPSEIAIGVIYPLDSLSPDDGSECVEDMVRRRAEKILLVTWTDNKSFSWADYLNPVRAIYDAESERPDYHERMKEIEADPVNRHVPASLPEYAKGCPPDRLIKIHCHRCNAGRWAELNKPYPGASAVRAADDGEYGAKCLKCGGIARDNYNW